jgi:hypothetical protein
MKNLPILSLFLIFSLQIGRSQQVSSKNWTLIHERTATWCPYCGTWGWDFKESLVTKFKNSNVIFMAVHYSGDLMNPTATEFDANYGGIGQPIFYADGSDLIVTSNNQAQKLNEASLIVDFKNTNPAFAGVGIDAELNKNTNTLTVNAKVEFFSDVEGGEYYLGLYLLEDVVNTQASRTGVQTHQNVLRKSLFPTTFGNKFHTGSVQKGKSFTMSTTTANITADRDKIKILGVIWTKVSNKYLFFNANVVNAAIPADSDDEQSAIEFKTFQAESGAIVVDLKNVSVGPNSVINVTDVSGKVVASQALLGTDSGNSIEINGNFAPGIHIVTLNNNDLKTSKKLIVK